MPMSEWACCPVAFPCPAGTFLPSSSPHCIGLSCCASCHKESCPWKPEKQFSISSGQEFQLFHHLQGPMMFLVNVTQLVEYPLLLSHTVLYFVTLDFAGVSECASCRIVRWFRVLQLPLHPPPFTLPPSWAPRYLLPVSILACRGQLFNLFPWCPVLWNHHSLLQP